MCPKVEVNLGQLAKALEELSPGELGTLGVCSNLELRVKLNDRWAEAKRELKKENILSKGKLVAE